MKIDDLERIPEVRVREEERVVGAEREERLKKEEDRLEGLINRISQREEKLEKILQRLNDKEEKMDKEPPHRNQVFHFLGDEGEKREERRKRKKVKSGKRKRKEREYELKLFLFQYVGDEEVEKKNHGRDVPLDLPQNNIHHDNNFNPKQLKLTEDSQRLAAVRNVLFFFFFFLSFLFLSIFSFLFSFSSSFLQKKNLFIKPKKKTINNQNNNNRQWSMLGEITKNMLGVLMSFNL